MLDCSFVAQNENVGNSIDPSDENVPRALLGKTAMAAKFHLFSWIPVPSSL